MRNILLAEDDALTRMLISEVLEEAGFFVSPVATEADAIALMATSTASYELLITDFSFGDGKGGDAVSAEWRASYPGRPLIFATGKNRDDLGPLAKGEVFLPKPYCAQQILEAVHDLLH